MKIFTVLTFSFNHEHDTYRTGATQREEAGAGLRAEEEAETLDE